MTHSSFVYCPMCRVSLKQKVVEGDTVQICPACGYINWNNPKPTVSIVIHKDNTVLLLQRSTEPFKDYWVLPGGFMNGNESPIKAIIRESQEEIGVTPQVGEIIDAYRIGDDPRGIHIDIIYEGIITEPVIVSPEHSVFQFFSMTALPNQIAYKHRDAIQAWANRFMGTK